LVLGSTELLSGFVANGTPDLNCQICQKFGHTMLFASMFHALLQNILLVSPFATKSQSTPTSLQLTTFDILPPLTDFSPNRSTSTF
jgi:hypothetical protein